jgi:hypothetical protein
MHITKLDAHEGSAIIAAAKAISLDTLTDCMTALYDIGVRNLDEATPDQFEHAAVKLAEGGIVSPLANRISEALAVFGSTLRDELSNKPPF